MLLPHTFPAHNADNTLVIKSTDSGSSLNGRRYLARAVLNTWPLTHGVKPAFHDAETDSYSSRHAYILTSDTSRGCRVLWNASSSFYVHTDTHHAPWRCGRPALLAVCYTDPLGGV